MGPLSGEDPETLSIVLVENRWKAARRPYHKQKLTTILANLRHFALEQAVRGVAVPHVIAANPYSKALEVLRIRRDTLDKAAKVLLEKEKIDGEELKTLISENSASNPS